MSLLLASVLDVTIVLSVALIVTAVLRRRAASLRHAILAAAVVTAVAIPAIEATVPQWALPIAWSTTTATSSTLLLTSAAAPQPEAVAAVPPATVVSWRELVLFVWLAGTLVVAAGLTTGLVRLALVTRRCRPLDSGPWFDLAQAMARRRGLRRPVAVLQSGDPAVLLTWGLVRPRILVPESADGWTDERREVVLAHELAHIARHDWAVQLLAELLRAVYWFNPLVWVVCSRVRHESECACDDVVLSGGVEATEYATHLLDVARLAVDHAGAWASAPAVAHPSTLERRIAAMLNEPRHRQPLTRRAFALAAVGAFAVAVPVAAVAVTERAAQPVSMTTGHDVALIVADEPPSSPAAASASAAVASAPVRVPEAAPAAQQTPARLAGTLIDATGAVLPGVDVTLTDTQFGARYSAATDGYGQFTFPELQPSRYELVLRLPGFSTVANVMSLAAGASAQRTITMSVGGLEETITVGCAASPVAMGGASPAMALMEVRRSSGRLFESERTPREHWVRDNPPVAPAFQQTDAATPVRVGGQIRVPRQLRHVNPVCPPAFVPAGGALVTLVGRIGVDGYMNEVRHVPADAGNPPAPEFVESALDAVRQWQYTQTLLNNMPVEVNVTMRVRYQRMGGDRQ